MALRRLYRRIYNLHYTIIPKRPKIHANDAVITDIRMGAWTDV